MKIKRIKRVALAVMPGLDPWVSGSDFVAIQSFTVMAGLDPATHAAPPAP